MASEGRAVIIGIETGSAYNAAKLWGNSIGVPGIGGVEGESGAEILNPRGPVTVSTGFAPGLGLRFELEFRGGEGSEEIVSPHLGRKHDVILTTDASGRSRFNILLLRVLLLSVAAELCTGSRIPGITDVARDGGGVIGRLLPALAGSELDP